MSVHPYVEKLAAKIAASGASTTRVRARTVLKQFGYSKRRDTVLATISEAFRAANLEIRMTVDDPPSLDDRVLIQLAHAQAPLVDEPAAVLGPAMAPYQLPTSPVPLPKAPSPGESAPASPAQPEPAPPSPVFAAPQATQPAGRPAARENVAQAPLRSETPVSSELFATVSRPTPAVGFARRMLVAARQLLGRRATAPLSIVAGTTVLEPVAPPPAAPPAAAPAPPAAPVPQRVDAPDAVDVAERAIKATVQVAVEGASGSGFFVHPSGLVVTNCHVVKAGDGILPRARVLTSDGRENEASVVRAHSGVDYALLWVDAPGPYPCLPLGRPDRLRHAEAVITVGNPGMAGGGPILASTVSTGVVANPQQRFRGIDYIQMTAAISPGNSGGPLVNSRGEAVGINTWAVEGMDAARFAVPIDYLTADIRAALARGREAGQHLCSCCGWPDPDPTWYCRNCGLDITPTKEQE